MKLSDRDIWTDGLSRHGFLRLALMTGVGGLLSACSSRVPTSTPTAAPTAIPTLPPLPVTNASPLLAGELVAVSEDSLILRSAVQTRTFTLPSTALLYDAAGAATSSGRLLAGRSVAVWLEDDTEVISAAQVLPELARINVDPTVVPQPEPTGETKAVGALTMITRAGWGAADPVLTAPGETGRFDPDTNRAGWMTYTEPLADVLNTAVIHHSAGSFIDGAREIQRFHIARRGYADIAYHYVIDGFGVLFEGRTLKARGAHTGGANTGTVGIVLLGDFNRISVPRAQLQTAAALAAWLAAEYGITHIAGHRDFQPDVTECPGDNLEAWLPGLASAVGLRAGTEGYVIPDWAR